MTAIATSARITEWARMALIAMRQRHIAPTPENYAVWFSVAADADPALSELVHRLDERGTVYDEVCNWEIYERFFGEQKERVEIEAIGDRVETHLGAIGDLVDQIVHGASRYGNSLDGLVDTIPRCHSPTDLNRALSVLRQDTQSIIDRADRWGEAASAQAAEVARLKRDLNVARKEAETDELTQIGNRKRFERRLREATRLARDSRVPLSIGLMDVDHFKSFNDTYGHAVGDRVLKLVAKRIDTIVQEPVEVFRYGGEEFAFLAPTMNLGKAIEAAETIRKAVASIRVARKSDSEPLRQVTISIGVSEYGGRERITDMVERADVALYTAKNNGRNCTSIKRVDARLSA